jgi:DNA repair protein RadC
LRTDDPDPPCLPAVGRSARIAAAIQGSEQVVEFMRRVVRDDAREHFLALYLDGRHRPIAHLVVSVGTASASLVHPREVFQPAILVGACAVAVGHSHPSGDPSPSREDCEITRRLAQAGTLLGVALRPEADAAPACAPRPRARTGSKRPMRRPTG